MKTEEWVTKFTGLELDGTASGTDPDEAVRAFEHESQRKQLMLAQAYKSVAPLKGDFQKAMSREVSIVGSWRKQRMLEIEGTQIDEAEFEEIDWKNVKLSKETQAVIDEGTRRIQRAGLDLQTALSKRNGKTAPLFTPMEIEDGYWFVLTRERILPETYVGALFSKTQRMLDETNKLYLAAVEVKRERGELTPKTNRIKDLAVSGAELLAVGAEMTAAFGPGTENAKLAATVLNGMSAALNGAGEAYDKLKARKYADGSKTVLGTMKALTSMALKIAGVDPAVIKTTEKAFDAGGAAITAGKHFARGIEGAADGTTVFAGVLQAALEIAAGEVKNEQLQRDLKIAAVAAPAALKGAAAASKMIQSLDRGDVSGVVDCLGEFAGTALGGVQGIRTIEATQGRTGDEASKIQGQLDKETAAIQGHINVAKGALKVTAEVALAIKSGTYRAAFEKLIDGIGANLTTCLTTAGLEEKDAQRISLIYKSTASGSKALQCLMSENPDIDGALRNIAGGIGAAFAAAAPGTDLKKVGESVELSVTALADVAKVRRLFEEQKYEEAMAVLTTGFQSKLASAFKIAGIEPKTTEGSKEVSGADVATAAQGSDLKKALEAIGLKAKAAEALIAKNATDAMEEKVQEALAAEAQEEAQAMMAEADLTPAEAFSREAADIDKLIAKVARDQMIMKVAVQIMQGGTAFLATFVPGLGAVSAGLRMMTNLVTAAQRAQQLAYWVNNQKDLEAAQSALSSSAQNFVKNQAEQFSHYSIQAAFAAAEMIGQVLRTAGAATYGAMEAAGLGLAMASKAGAKLEEVIRKHYKAEALEAAWRITQRSLKNPSNRKLGLRARAQNPTLAKYSIAWGAVKLKDPLARNAMRACNLTEAVLESENTNVDKVVAYLETFYEEDDKLYREVSVDGPWVPKDIVLSLRFWANFKKLAVDNVKLGNPATGEIDGLLAQLQGDTSTLDEGQIVGRIAVLEQLDRALGAYTPNITDEKGRNAFRSAVALLRKRAKADIVLLEKRQEKLHRDKAEKDDKDRQARAQLMAEKRFVLSELEVMIARLESFDDADDPAEIQDTRYEASQLVKEVAGLKPLLSDQPVQSRLKMLQTRMQDADRLIGMLAAA